MILVEKFKLSISRLAKAGLAADCNLLSKVTTLCFSVIRYFVGYFFTSIFLKSPAGSILLDGHLKRFLKLLYIIFIYIWLSLAEIALISILVDFIAMLQWELAIYFVFLYFPSD